MRHTFKTLAAALICLTLSVPTFDAYAAPERERRTESMRQGRSQKDQKHPGSRKPASHGRPAGNTPATPSRPASPSRPSQPSQPPRPSQPSRPSGNNRPNTPPPPPPQNHRPPVPNRPGAVHRPPVAPPPHRPGRPAAFPAWNRPVPPPSWRPYRGCPSFATALGITFGTALMTSLDYLLNSGYTVDGYSADQVYLRNVSQMNYMWPDATLFYNSGGLVGSSYTYSTPGYNASRYYSVYNSLVSQYGQPAVTLNISGGMGVRWFGNNGAFVTLQLAPQYTAGGDLRYFTTLSFGN